MRQIWEKTGGEAVSDIFTFAHKLKEFLPRRLSQISKEELDDGVSTAENPHSEDHDRAMAWAERLAARAPLAVQGTKLAVNAQIKQALLTSFDVSTALELPSLLSADHAEAVDAFVAGRTPAFEGR